MKLSALAEALGARLVSDGREDTEIIGVAGMDEAEPGKVTFVNNPKYAAAAKSTKASAVIVTEDFPAIAAATLRVRNPHLAFARAVDLFYQPPKYARGVHPTAVVHQSARIAEGAHLGPYVVIGEEVEIGANATLLAHVVIYRGARIGRNFFAHAHAVVREFCRLGDDVLLQNGVVIGSDGFGFARDDQGNWRKITQAGIAVLEDDVEVQANSCVNRASLGETLVARNTKVDDLVLIGHNSRIGERSMICGQAGLAGSTTVGKDVILAGQVGVAGHLTIGDGVIATAQTGIPNDVEPGKVISGYPAMDNKQWLRSVAVFNRLPELAKAVRGAGKEKE